MGFAPKRIARALREAGHEDPDDLTIRQAMAQAAADHGYDLRDTSERVEIIRTACDQLAREAFNERMRQTERMLGVPELRCYAPGDGALSFTYQQERHCDGVWIAVGSPEGHRGMRDCRRVIEAGNYNPCYDLIPFQSGISGIRMVHFVERVDLTHLRMTPSGYHKDWYDRDTKAMSPRPSYDDWHRTQVEDYRYEVIDRVERYRFFYEPSEQLRALGIVEERELLNWSDTACLRFYLQNEEFLLRWYLENKRDFQLSPAAHARIFDGPWNEDPLYTVEAWQAEVCEDNTRQGYWEWARHQREIAEDEKEADEDSNAEDTEAGG